METKAVMDLTDDQLELLISNGHMINMGDVYVNLPYWFKKTEVDNRVEVFYEDQLPDNVKLFIRNVSIKQALERLIELQTKHNVDGYSAIKEWDEAFDDAITALDYEV